MPVKIFFCYAHEDEALLDKLKMHLRPLQRQSLIDIWYDRNISAGTEWVKEIDKHLNTADIVLLLVSPAFMDSDYCYGIEMKRAIERHEQGQTRVIPIILEYVYWQVEPLTSLQALPKDAKPIVSASWHSQNEAFYNVVEGIHKVVDELPSKATNSLPKTSIQQKKIDAPQRFVNIPQRDEVKPEDFSLLRYIPVGKVRSVAFSPNGQLLASGSSDNSIKLWNPYNGSLLLTLTGHSKEIQSVAFSWIINFLLVVVLITRSSYGIPTMEACFTP